MLIIKTNKHRIYIYNLPIAIAYRFKIYRNLFSVSINTRHLLKAIDYETVIDVNI